MKNFFVGEMDEMVIEKKKLGYQEARLRCPHQPRLLRYLEMKSYKCQRNF